MTIEVFDMTGKRVIWNQTSTFQSSLNLDGMEKGIYIVKMTTRGEEVHSSKLVIK